MTPRAYTLSRRALSQQETRERILEATVALHAQKGSIATSYAEIAQRADVAVPTVYKHFPDRGALLAGCTAHASKDAPALGPQVLEGVDGAPARLRALFDAAYRRHEYLEPWMRWREDRIDPDLAAIFAPMGAAMRSLIEAAIASGKRSPPKAAVALATTLGEYSAWESLVRGNGLTTSEAAELAAETVAAVLQSSRKRSTT